MNGPDVCCLPCDTQMTDILDSPDPVDFRQPPYDALFAQLQGNIVKGHGRRHTVNVFLEFHVRGSELRRILRFLAGTYVTSAYRQLEERELCIRGVDRSTVFGNLFLSRCAYIKLGFRRKLPRWFDDRTSAGRSPFVHGMRAAADELGDTLGEAREPLEIAYTEGRIDALLLLAYDDPARLTREVAAITQFLRRDDLARVLAVEPGAALFNERCEGIEHFGYVDGRSQPLFLSTDFRSLDAGRIGPAARERVSGAGTPAGPIDVWNPFAPLALALIRDPAVSHPLAFGSYYVFRKLEQDVAGFAAAEQRLADALGLKGAHRSRAGAMIVGRFRDGTPLVLSGADGFTPARANNFRYDGLNASFEHEPGTADDPFGLKCPFQAHIRKVNPRQNVNVEDSTESVPALARRDRSRRIVRRGIPYGPSSPGDGQSGVGLLFACFQASIRDQFAFMQGQWANNTEFMVTGEASTGLDAVIGHVGSGEASPQRWRRDYGGTISYNGRVRFLPLPDSHGTEFDFRGFVRFRGGEYFFAPSLTFLLGE